MAAGNTSTLQVEVISKGIADTVRKLDSLGAAAERNEKRVTKLTDSLKNLMTAQASAVNSAAQHSNLMNAIAQAMGVVSNAAATTANQVRSLTQNMNQLIGASNRATEALDRKSRAGGVVNTTLRAMATAAAAYLGVNFARGIVASADGWAMMAAKLNIATGSMHNAKVVQEELFELAQKYRSPLEDMGRLYTRLAPAMQNLGKSSKQTHEMVEGVALALKLSGATGAEASSVMLQFSQAVNAGRLNGAEFNAVAEGAPIILKALEAQTGKTRGQLKQMGADGKLSVELIQAAMEAQLPKWRENFAKLPLTVDGAITRIKNAWFKAMGEMGEDSGMNRGLAETLKIIEDLIPTIRDEMVGAFIAVGKWIGENKTALGEMWEQTKALVKDVWNLVAALGYAAGAATGVANEFSLIGLAIYSVRLAVAGVQDGFTLIGAVLLKVGALIAPTMTAPLNIVLTVVENILGGITKLFSGLAIAADAVGLEALNKSMLGVKEATEGWKNSLTGVKSNVTSVGEAMNDASNKAFEMLANGEGAVQRVLKGEEQITAAVKERAKYQELANGKGGDKPVDEKAANAAQKALEKHQKAVDDLNNSLKEQIELNNRLNQFGLDYDKLGKGAKERIAIQTELDKLQGKELTQTEAIKAARLQELLAITLKVEAMEGLNQSVKEELEAEQAKQRTLESRVKTALEEAANMERKVKTYGMLKGAVEELELAEIEAELTRAKLNKEDAARIGMLEQLLAAKRRYATASAELGALEGATEAQKALDKFLDPEKANKFGNILKDCFGAVGDSIGKMTGALGEFMKKERDAAKLKADLEKNLAGDPKKLSAAMNQFYKQQAKNALNSYGDMAAAAKGFFKENSKGYKTLEVVEKTFRAAEMAMALESFITKSGFISTLTGLFVTGEAQKQAVEVSSAATSIATTQAVTAAKATQAVVNQGGGDPYSAFVRIAAMAAIMAGLGFAVSGGSGKAPDIAGERQKRQGTGTVFGDSEAKSESISNALEMLRDNSDIGLEHSSKMLMALRNIEASMAGLVNAIIRAKGITSGKNMGIFEGQLGQHTGDPLLGMFGINDSKGGLYKAPVIGGLVKSLHSMWGKTTQSITDAGILINGSMSQLSGGNGMQQYADIETKKTSMFGMKKKYSYSSQYGALDNAVSNQLGLVFSNIADAVHSAGVALGRDSASLEAQINSFVLNLGKVSLKGLSGQALTDALNAVISSAADQLAGGVMAGFEDFQKVGEGYFETLMRVASGFESAQYMLDNLGVMMVGLGSIQNKQGDITAELVRESLALKESGSNVAQFMRELDGSAEELIESYKKMVDIRTNLKLTGLANDITRSMIKGAGGLDNLQQAMSDYMENMYTDQERYAMSVQKLSGEFSKIGVAMPATKAAFKTLVNNLMHSGAAGEELAAKVMMLSGAFSELEEQAEDNVLTARDRLRDAYDMEVEKLEEVKSKFEDFAKSLNSFKDSLTMGALSPLTLAQKYANASARYNDVVNRAQAGDTNALAEFEKVAQEFLSVSQQYNASGVGYTADFNSVLTQTEIFAAYAESQVDVATASLEALNKQVEGLLDINESVLTVAQAINELHLAIALRDGAISPTAVPTGGTQTSAADSALYKIAKNYVDGIMSSGVVRHMGLSGLINGSHADGLPYVPFDGYVAELHKGESVLTAQEAREYRTGSGKDEALCEEIKALREEVKRLREEQREQTGNLIASNYDANERNAQIVVSGVDDAMSKAARTEAVKPTLN